LLCPPYLEPRIALRSLIFVLLGAAVYRVGGLFVA